MTLAYRVAAQGSEHRVVARYLARVAAVDPKKSIEKLLKDAERRLKTFTASLPVQVKVNTRVELATPAPRGGYGPYIVGQLDFGYELSGGDRPIDKHYQINVTMDLSDGVVGVGVKSGNYVFNTLSSRGILTNAGARLKKGLSFIEDRLKEEAKKVEAQQPRKEPEPSEETWSVTTVEDGYASHVEVFGSKEKAQAYARDHGNCYLMKGTQMWNEPLGQIEESDRPAKTLYVR